MRLFNLPKYYIRLTLQGVSSQLYCNPFATRKSSGDYILLHLEEELIPVTYTADIAITSSIGYLKIALQRRGKWNCKSQRSPRELLLQITRLARVELHPEPKSERGSNGDLLDQLLHRIQPMLNGWRITLSQASRPIKFISRTRRQPCLERIVPDYIESMQLRKRPLVLLHHIIRGHTRD